MITLDAATKSLEIKLAGAVATTQPPFVASYVDINQTTFAQTTSSESDGTTNSGTAVTAVAAPGAGITRKLNYLSIVNVDTAVVVLTVQVNNNSTKRISWQTTLAIGDCLFYVDGVGFKQYDSNGQAKTGPTVVTLTSGVTGTLPIANGGTGLASYSVGDIPYFATGTALSKLADVATGSVLISGGVGVAPSWSTTPTFIATNVTGVPAASLVGSHTLPDGVLSTNVPLLNAANVSTAKQTAQLNDAGFTILAAAGGTRSYDWFRSSADGIAVWAGNEVSTGAFRWMTNSGGGLTSRMALSNAGLLTVSGYGAGAATFDASGNITSVSDRRFKNRIKTLPYGLKEIIKLKPVQYGYNKLSKLERKHLYGGFLTQQVKPFIPLAVGRDQRGYQTLADRPILGAVVNSIRELNLRLKSLERRMN